ncbi:lebercilin-like protein isoform X2 [Myripristis murdjan]|uniref:lebercilin-like protein isoform X2 n=1 Tax=Myripristis murdjan TaxID=586833 RepID=UPI001175D42B|nr:lebercilin-like protein isoform X2 [Myripristis murdjan]
MSLRQQNLEQEADGHNKEAGGDAASYSGDRSSSSPSSREGNSDGPYYSSDFEDKPHSIKNKIPEAHMEQRSQIYKRKKVKKANKAKGQGLKQKTNCTANHKVFKLPPIKPLQVPGQRIHSAQTHRIKELSSQVWDLQHQLSGVEAENRLLKRLQHRHMVALQHFQDTENSLPQLLAKHSNEVRALQEMLRSSRLCNNNLARQLRATDNKLMHTKETLQHLQQLSQDHKLLEREELTHRLAEVTAELDKKNRKIKDLEKNLQLCQISFNRQIVTEIKKTDEAIQISAYLRGQINQLTQKIKEREKELEVHNIYSHRFSKGMSKKGRENKMVQTVGLFRLPTEASGHMAIEYSKPEKWHEGHQNFGTIAFDYPNLEDSKDDKSEDEDDLDDAEKCGDTGELSSCSDHDSVLQAESNVEENKAVGGPQTSEQEKKEESEDLVSYALENSQKTAQPQCKGFKVPNIRHHYTFKQTIENLHAGKPAYSSMRENSYESIKNPMRERDLSTMACGPSPVSLSAGKTQNVEEPNLCERKELDRKICLMKELFGPSVVTNLVRGKCSDMETRPSSCCTDFD